MVIKHTIKKGFDEYLTHDGEIFWRYVDGQVKWLIKRGGRWISANIEYLEPIYQGMDRLNKLERICNGKI
jgi:hypothetical protein